MLKIRKIVKDVELYDINVEDNHNFYANGILVHNCTESTSPARPSTNLKKHYNKETNEASETFTPGRTHTCNLISLNVSDMSLKDIENYSKQAEALQNASEKIQNSLTQFIETSEKTTEKVNKERAYFFFPSLGALNLK